MPKQVTDRDKRNQLDVMNSLQGVLAPFGVTFHTYAGDYAPLDLWAESLGKPVLHIETKGRNDVWGEYSTWFLSSDKYVKLMTAGPGCKWFIIYTVFDGRIHAVDVDSLDLSELKIEITGRKEERPGMPREKDTIIHVPAEMFVELPGVPAWNF